MFSADQQTLISCGEDNIFHWNFFGRCDKPDSTKHIPQHAIKESDCGSPTQLIPTRDSGLSPQHDNTTPQPRKAAPRPTNNGTNSAQFVIVFLIYD